MFQNTGNHFLILTPRRDLFS